MCRRFKTNSVSKSISIDLAIAWQIHGQLKHVWISFPGNLGGCHTFHTFERWIEACLMVSRKKRKKGREEEDEEENVVTHTGCFKLVHTRKKDNPKHRKTTRPTCYKPLSADWILSAVWNIICCIVASNANDRSVLRRHNRGYKLRRYVCYCTCSTLYAGDHAHLHTMCRLVWWHNFKCIYWSRENSPGTFVSFVCVVDLSVAMLFEKPSDIDTFIKFTKSQGGQWIVVSIVMRIIIFMFAFTTSWG